MVEVTRATVEEFLELLRKDPELRERAREIIVAADWERVDRAIEALAAEVRAFAAETRARIAELERATNTRFNELTLQFEEFRADMDQRFEQVDRRFAATDEKIESLRADMDRRFEQVDQRFAATDEKIESLRADMDQRFEQVDQRFEQVDQRFEQVEVRLENVEVRLENVEVRLENVEVRLENVEVRLENVEGRLGNVEQRLGKVEGNVGNLIGEALESKFTLTPAKYLGTHFRGVRPISIAEDPELERALESGVVTEDEFRDLLRSDAVVRATPRKPPAPERVVAVEVSNVVDRRDVERAARRAEVLSRVWPGAEGAVFGNAITRGAMDEAGAAGVRVLVEQVVDEAEAGAA